MICIILVASLTLAKFLQYLVCTLTGFKKKLNFMLHGVKNYIKIRAPFLSVHYIYASPVLWGVKGGYVVNVCVL